MSNKNLALKEEAIPEADTPDSPDKDLGRQILDHVQDGYKVGHEHFKAAGLKLTEAKKGRTKKDFNQFLVAHCNGLSYSWACQLIAIAEGRTTVEKVRAKNNERKKSHRAKAAKVTRSVPEQTKQQPVVEPPRNNVVVHPATMQPAQKSSLDPWGNFKFAVDHWVPKMPPATKLQALDYLKAKINLVENAENPQ